MGSFFIYSKTPEMLDWFGVNCPYPDLTLLVKERYEHLMPDSPASKVNFKLPMGRSFRSTISKEIHTTTPYPPQLSY